MVVVADRATDTMGATCVTLLYCCTSLLYNIYSPSFDLHDEDDAEELDLRLTLHLSC